MVGIGYAGQIAKICLASQRNDISAGDRRRPAGEVGVGSNGNGILRLVVQGDGQGLL